MQKIKFGIFVVMCCGCVGCHENHEWIDLEVQQQAILHGALDRDEAHAGVVALYRVKNSYACGKADIICTGTLVHPQWMITAAHCLYEMREGYYEDPVENPLKENTCNADLRIGIGNNRDDVVRHLYEVDQIYGHDGFMTQYSHEDERVVVVDRDIALIRLKEAVPVDVAVPIPILPAEIWETHLQSSDIGHYQVVGYGFDESGALGNKLKIDIPRVETCVPQSHGCEMGTYCEFGYRDVKGCHPDDVMEDGRCWSPMNHTEYVTIPCGGILYDQQEGGPCQGDSGGPLLMDLEGRTYLVGITSYGDAICQVYGVSTSVPDYWDWIVGIAPEIAEQRWEICDNDADDDGNGWKDCEDPACLKKEHCHVEEEPSEDLEVGQASSCSGSRGDAQGIGLWGIWGIFGVIWLGKRKRNAHRMQ